jgi:Ca-activated chloride channel family protein
MLYRGFAALLCCCLLAGVPAAQTPEGPRQPSQAVFRGGVDVVSLNVTVRNRSNKTIPDLSAADFVVFEDGRPQPLIEVSRRRLPLSLSFLIDSSGSMSDKLDMAQSAASEFVRRLGPDDQAAVVSFECRVQFLQPFTIDHASLDKAIHRIKAGGSTALFNAVYIALKDLERMKASAPEDIRRQAIVVLSDGDDTASNLTFDDVLDLAKRSHTSIYAIGIRSNPVPTFGSSSNNDGDFVIRHLAQDTGGTAFFPQESRELPRIYREVADELASEYFVAYTSTNAVHDGKWRNVSVRVARADTVARTRPGYFAPAR